MVRNIGLSVIVPIFNEGPSLWPMAEAISQVCNEILGEEQWNFVLVDNGSKDHTPEIVNQILKKWPLSQSLKLDKPDYGNALHTGLTAARGQWAWIINVDFWDGTFLSWSWKNRHRYDLILGSKRADSTLNKQGRYRRTLSWGLNSVLQFTFGFVGTDTHGQKLLNLSTMRSILEQCKMRRGQYDTEFTLRSMRAGLWLAEVPVPIEEIRPQRNWMFAKIFRNLRDILRLRKLMKKVPFTQGIRYHRWARLDMTEELTITIDRFPDTSAESFQGRPRVQ